MQEIELGGMNEFVEAVLVRFLELPVASDYSSSLDYVPVSIDSSNIEVL